MTQQTQNPSPDEIAERCREIQSTWTPTERLRRLRPDWRPQVQAAEAAVASQDALLVELAAS